MSSSKYLLLKCDSCGTSWVSTTPAKIYVPSAARGGVAYHHKNTIECPHCGQTHATDQLSIIATAYDKPTLRAQRSKRLAEQAGCEDVCQQYDDYKTQRERAENYLPEAAGRFDVADDVLGSVGTDEYGVSSALADATLGTVAADEYEVSDSAVESTLGSVGADDYDISAVDAEAVLGTVGTDEYGPNITDDQTLASVDRTVEDTTPVSLTRDDTEQETAGEIVLDGQPPSDVWACVTDELRQQIASSVRSTVGSADISPPRAVAQAIADGNAPTRREQIMGSRIVRLSDPDRSQQLWEAMRFVRSLGSGECLGGIYSGIGDVCKVASLIDVDHPIVVHIKQGFESQRADQRRDICRTLTALSAGADIYIVTETLQQQRWLAHAHESDLPGSLIDQCNTDQNAPSPKSEVIQKAIDRFDIDGGIIELLRSVAHTPTETRTFDKLENELGVVRNTIHNRLHHLREYDLVSETLSTADGSAVSLTSTGRAYLDAVYESAGVQTALEESLIAGGKSANNMPCNPARPREGGGGWDRNRLPSLHETRQLPRHRLHATTATVDNTDISVVDTDVDTLATVLAPVSTSITKIEGYSSVLSTITLTITVLALHESYAASKFGRGYSMTTSSLTLTATSSVRSFLNTRSLSANFAVSGISLTEPPI